jgi:hypothetical protein
VATGSSIDEDSQLAEARRRVIVAKGIVDRQRERIAILQARGQSPLDLNDDLELFVGALKAFEEHEQLLRL